MLTYIHAQISDCDLLFRVKPASWADTASGGTKLAAERIAAASTVAPPALPQTLNSGAKAKAPAGTSPANGIAMSASPGTSTCRVMPKPEAGVNPKRG